MLRFRLRTLLIAVSMMCVAFAVCAWVQRQRAWIAWRHLWVLMPSDVPRSVYVAGVTAGRIGEVPAPWSLRLFGEHGVGVLYVDETLERESKEFTASLFPEAEIRRQPPLDTSPFHFGERLED